MRGRHQSMHQDHTLTAEEKRYVLAAVCIAAYTISLLMMGASWWKAPAIALMFAMLFLAGWGERWIARGALMLLVAGSMVWLGVLPPPTQWQPMATTVVASFTRG
jgi:hypothetical protein